MSLTSPEFVPENELERAYAQSHRWTAYRVWRRASSNLAAGRYSAGAGFLMRLASIYTFSYDSGRLNESMMSICDHEHLLKPVEKKSICRICLQIVNALFLTGNDAEESRVAIFVFAMFKLTGSLKVRDFVFIEMLGYLRSLKVENLKPEDIQKTIDALSHKRPSYVRGAPGNPLFARVAKAEETSPEKPRRHFRIIPADVRQNRFENSSKFVAMLAAAALEKCQQNTKPEGLPELLELVRFYEECSGETARYVGEMMWLLMETELCHDSDFLTRLAVLSVMKASDTYSIERFLVHIERLSSLLPDSAPIKDLEKLIHALLVGKGESFDKDIFRVVIAGEKAKFPMNMKQVDAQIASGNWQFAFDLTAQLLQVKDISREDTFRLLVRSARIRIGQLDTLGGTLILYKLFFGLRKLL
jgi:hypothetical protein